MKEKCMNCGKLEEYHRSIKFKTVPITIFGKIKAGKRYVFCSIKCEKDFWRDKGVWKAIKQNLRDSGIFVSDIDNKDFVKEVELK